MPDSHNLARLKEAYRVWNDARGENKDCWLDLMGDEVCIRSVGEQGPGLDFAGECHSKKGAVDYFSAILNDWEMIHWTPHTFLEEGGRIAMFGRCAWTCRKTGADAEVDIAHLWRFEDGKIVDLVEVFDSAKVVAAASAGGRSDNHEPGGSTTTSA